MNLHVFVLEFNSCNSVKQLQHKNTFFVAGYGFCKKYTIRPRDVCCNKHAFKTRSFKQKYLNQNNLEYIPHSGIKFSFAFSKANFFRNTSIYPFLMAYIVRCPWYPLYSKSTIHLFSMIYWKQMYYNVWNMICTFFSENFDFGRYLILYLVWHHM